MISPYTTFDNSSYGKPPTHSYQRLQQLLHHVLGHDHGLWRLLHIRVPN